MSEVSIAASSVELFIDRLETAFHDCDANAAAKVHECENVRKLQEQYRALARNDLDAVWELLDEEVDLELRVPANLPIGGRWRGRAAVKAATQANYKKLADQAAELLRVVAQGDLVVLYTEERGRVRGGDSYHIKWMQIYTFRDGKVMRIEAVAAPAEG